jgi:hypothetical protein
LGASAAYPLTIATWTPGLVHQITWASGTNGATRLEKSTMDALVNASIAIIINAIVTHFDQYCGQELCV